MELLSLNLHPREANGKGGARKKRALGLVPVTIYGEGQDPVNAEVDMKTFLAVTGGKLGESALVEMTVEGQAPLGGPAMIRAVQHHPVSSKVISADLQRIRLDKPVINVVPIKFVGQCKGLLEGGITDQHMHRIQVQALPLDIPENVEADLTNTGIGDAFHVRNLTPIPGVTVLTKPERSIIAIKAPRASKRPTAPDAKAAKKGAAAKAPAGKAPAKK